MRAAGERDWAPRAALSLAAASSVAWLLRRSLFEGRAQSFDAALYARSLWGLAHGDLHNSVFGGPSWSIHGQLALALLAPFARVAPAALVLAVAQALALGLTAYVVGGGFADAARAHGRPVWLAAVAGTLAALGAPLVANPFVFDVRPDLLAVPLLTWGLVRAVRRGAFDRASLAALVAALVAREDFAVVVAAAMLAPVARGAGSATRRTRVGVAALSLAYFALYVRVLRPWLGASAADRYDAFAWSMIDAPALDGALAARGEIVFAAVAGFGGLGLLAPRWALVAAPGLAFALAQTRLAPLVPQLHYAMFAAPGLAAAAVAGFGRACASPPRRWVAALGLAGALASFAVTSALPGGHRFRAGFFGVGLDAAARARVASAHALLARVPAGVGVAAPYDLAAPLADRPTLLVSESFAAGARHDPGTVLDAPPSDLVWAAFSRRERATLARAFVGQHGFHLAGGARDGLVLLTRDARVPLAWDARAEVAPVACDVPRATWASAGLALCAVAADAKGRVAAAVRRLDGASLDARGLALFLVAEGAPPAPLLVADGLVGPAQLPGGVTAAAISERPLPGARGTLTLVDLAAGPVEARLAGGDTAREVPVAWVTAGAAP